MVSEYIDADCAHSPGPCTSNQYSVFDGSHSPTATSRLRTESVNCDHNGGSLTVASYFRDRFLPGSEPNQVVNPMLGLFLVGAISGRPQASRFLVRLRNR